MCSEIRCKFGALFGNCRISVLCSEIRCKGEHWVESRENRMGYSRFSTFYLCYKNSYSWDVVDNYTRQKSGKNLEG